MKNELFSWSYSLEKKPSSILLILLRLLRRRLLCGNPYSLALLRTGPRSFSSGSPEPHRRGWERLSRYSCSGIDCRVRALSISRAMSGSIAHTSGRGLHRRTTGSIPLVASKHEVGWGCKQFTMDSSPFNTRTMLVVYLSHMKKEPSSEPATIYCPSL